MNTNKRKIEVFSAGCPACEPTVQLVQKIACPSCDVQVLDMHKPEVAAKAKQYGVKTVPAVVVDGQLASCCTGAGPNEQALRSAGLGVPKLRRTKMLSLHAVLLGGALATPILILAEQHPAAQALSSLKTVNIRTMAETNLDGRNEPCYSSYRYAESPGDNRVQSSSLTSRNNPRGDAPCRAMPPVPGSLCEDCNEELL